MKDAVRMVIADVLEIEPALVSDDASRETLGEWDSLSHLRLVMALEETFGIRLTMGEIVELTSLQAITARVGASAR